MFFCTFFAQVYCNACSCIIVFSKTLLRPRPSQLAFQFVAGVSTELDTKSPLGFTARAANMICIHHLCINMYTTHMYLCICLYIYIYICIYTHTHKHPAGPEIVLVKPHVFMKMSMVLWRNDYFGSA